MGGPIDNEDRMVAAFERIASSLEKIANPNKNTNPLFDDWKEKGPGPLLNQNREDTLNQLSHAIVNEVLYRNPHTEQPGEAVFRVLQKHFDNLEDTDKKLATAYAEISQLRRARNSERLDGMKAVQALAETWNSSSEDEATLLGSIDELIEMNSPQSEVIE